MKIDYPALRHLWKMMAADLALLVAEWIVPLAEFMIVLLGDEAAAETVVTGIDIDVYLVWTFRCLRLLNWVGMIVHLGRLGSGFRPARVWYLLRIFVFLTVQVLNGLSNHSRLPIGVGNWTLFAAITTILSAIVTPPFLPLGNRAILKAGADDLRYYGMEKPAAANRRCGNLLAVFCWMLEGFILVFVSLWVGEYLITEYDLLSYLIAPDGSPFVQWALLILFLLIVLGALGVLILWGICAGRMKKTYRLLKGISE